LFLHKNPKYITFWDISLHSSFAFLNYVCMILKYFLEGDFITGGMKIKFY